MRNDLERMQDIWEAIIKIEKYAIQGKTEFLKSETSAGLDAAATTSNWRSGTFDVC